MPDIHAVLLGRGVPYSRPPHSTYTLSLAERKLEGRAEKKEETKTRETCRSVWYSSIISTAKCTREKVREKRPWIRAQTQLLRWLSSQFAHTCFTVADLLPCLNYVCGHSGNLVLTQSVLVYYFSFFMTFVYSLSLINSSLLI